MKGENTEKRLKAIKLKFVFFSTTCDFCRKEFKREKMWRVYRYGINQTSYKWYYCQKCMPTAEDVLYEIDTDEFPFGIAGVDDVRTFIKRDYTRTYIANNTTFERK